MSINNLLAAAVRRVNAQYSQLDEPEKVNVFTDRWVALEREVDTAIAAGDDLAAERAVQTWERHALEAFAEADVD